MADIAQYQFKLSDTDAVDTFIREYVLEAIDRVPEYDTGERLSFAPSGTNGRSAVVVQYEGDIEAIFEQERAHLDSLKEDGLVDDWECIHEFTYDEMAEIVGEQAATLHHQLGEVAARMAKVAYEEFDTFPAAVETFPEEDSDSSPVGWWAILHTVTVQANYSLDEELDAYRYGIDHTLRNFAEYHGEDAVDERIDNLKDTLEAMREDVKDGRLGP